MRLTMRQPIFLSILLFVCLNGFAQDFVIKRDSSRVKGTIKELSEEQVIIFLGDTSADSKVIIPAYEIAYVVLRNGYTKRYGTAVIVNSDAVTINGNAENYYREKVRRDSLNYYRYRQSLSINYLAFFNREISILYGRDYRQRHLYLQIPVSIGFNHPKVTTKYYFKDMFIYIINQKIFDAGAAAYYVPSYVGNVNFFIGPMYKFQLYSGEQVLLPETNQPLVVKQSVLMRNSVSISTGMMIRTKSRISASALISLGACHDNVLNKIKRSSTNKKVDPVAKPNDFYFWAGFMVGFSF